MTKSVNGSLALQGSCRSRNAIVGTLVADAVGMKQPIGIALILIVLSLLGFYQLRPRKRKEFP